MIFRTFREEDIKPFCEHCSTIFPGIPPEWFHAHYLYDPHRNLNAMFLAEEDGRIISTAQVFRREMFVLGYPVTVGAMGDVTTLEEYRMKGINKKLMQMAIDFMVENDIATSMLYTDKLDYYAKLGWFTVCRRYIEVDLTRADRLPAGYTLIPLDNLQQAREIYDISAKRFNGAYTRRDSDYWDQWVAHYLMQPMALMREGKMVAWMDTKPRNWFVFTQVQLPKDQMCLGDYASLPGEDWVVSMLAEYSRMIDGPAKATIPAPLMPGYNGAFVEDRNNMFRLNKPFMLGEQRIDTVSQLAELLADTVFWQADAY